MVAGEQWLGMIFKEALFGVVNFENAQNLRRFEKIQDWHSLKSCQTILSLKQIHVSLKSILTVKKFTQGVLCQKQILITHIELLSPLYWIV